MLDLTVNSDTALFSELQDNKKTASANIYHITPEIGAHILERIKQVKLSEEHSKSYPLFLPSHRVHELIERLNSNILFENKDGTWYMPRLGEQELVVMYLVNQDDSLSFKGADRFYVKQIIKNPKAFVPQFIKEQLFKEK